MKKTIYLLITALLILGVTGCSDDFLSASSTERQEAGAPAYEGAILANLASTYQIMLFDSYANQNYSSIPLMSDLRSDDIFKGGGDAGDQHQLYLLSLYTTTPQQSLDGLWSIFFTGIARSNNAISACENAIDVDEDDLNQYKAEAHYLRAYFTHWLWKFWGNIPYFEEPLTEPPYMTRQYTADEVYAEIMEDLDIATTDGWLDMNSSESDLGRINKATALMLKARVVMYQNDQSRYAEVTADMAEIINSNKFELFDDFAELWLDHNEFSIESIFEVNHLPEGKIWDNGWQGYGTNLPAFISPSELIGGSNLHDFKGGWGFGPVRQTTWDIFEEGDSRREGSINSFDQENYSVRFQDTGLFMAKYAARQGYNPQGDVDLNYANNFRLFRYAETLLNYAEMIVMHGQSPVGSLTAQTALDMVRERAFGESRPITATAENIKLERRREFVGEGMRFWDIVRWGDTSILTENLPEHNSVRTWNDNWKYLPIPQSEIDRTAGTEFALQQNPGYN